MIGPRITLKWFLIAAALIPMLVGTVGKQAYDDWQRREYFERQRQIAEKLSESGCGAIMVDGHLVEAHVYIGPTITAAEALTLLQDAAKLERLLVSGPLTRKDVELLADNKSLKKLSFSSSGPTFTNECLRIISSLSQLEALSIGESGITESGLGHLGELKNLSGLAITMNRIRGRALANVYQLPKLRSLSLAGSTVDDQGLDGISNCRLLVDLNLSRTHVRGPGLGDLKGLSELVRLDVSDTTLTTGNGLSQSNHITELEMTDSTLSLDVLSGLKEMDNVRRVTLRGASVSDAHLARLGSVPRLAHLNLMNTNVSDAGLVYVRHLKQLIRLDLRNTQVTADGARSLARDMPALDIVYCENTQINGDPKLRFEMQLQIDD